MYYHHASHDGSSNPPTDPSWRRILAMTGVVALPFGAMVLLAYPMLGVGMVAGLLLGSALRRGRRLGQIAAPVLLAAFDASRSAPAEARRRANRE